MCIVSCAHQPYFVLLGFPWILTSYCGHLWPLSVVWSLSEDPPHLPQAPQLVFSSLSQELASVRVGGDRGRRRGKSSGNLGLRDFLQSYPFVPRSHKFP